MKIDKLLYSIFLIVIQLSFANAADNREKKMKITMRECIEKAVTNNLDVKLSKLDIASQNENIIKRESVYDPSLNFSVAHKEDNYSASSSVANSLISSLTKKINSGATFDFQNSLTKNEAATSSNKNYLSEISIKVTQPLLKNYGKEINNIFIKIENNNKNITLQDFRNKLSSIISEIQNLYWDMVYYRELFEVKKQSMQLSINLLEDNKKKVELGTLAPYEIIQAEAGVASQTEDMIISENNIKNIEDQILHKLNLIDAEQYKNSELEPSDIPEYKPVVPEFEESYKSAVLYRPDYLSLKTEIENNNLKLKYYENQNKPSIDLSGSFSLNGYSDELFKSYSGINFSDNKWNIGASVNIPIGGRSSESDLSKEKIEKSKLLIKMKKLENTITTEIKTKLRNISALISRIEAAKKTVELAKANLNNEQKKFELNQTTSHELLQFQKELEDAKTKEIKSIIDYRKAVIDYDVSSGKILLNNNIITD